MKDNLIRANTKRHPELSDDQMVEGELCENAEIQEAADRLQCRVTL